MKIKRINQDEKAIRDLKTALDALKGAEHNPVDWVAVTRYIAPLVARIAARYASRYLARKLGRKLKTGVLGEVTEETAEHIVKVLTRSARALTKVSKK